ncbi:MAG TPA: hydroxymethylglutaryl-CoA synthase [Gammaproteobacteria bacterium]|nr:hydroxymethylglutaryl-CoA synthase [Gammaproteobacteria bacterium]
MTSPVAYGIEDIRVYPTSLSLNIADLCRARGLDQEYVAKSLLTDERGVNPPWEDPVTMAVNAAAPMLARHDRDRIGLLIVGTETGLDQEKPLSSWIHHHLGLSPNCRNFEIKYACYGTTAAIHMALAWLRTPEGAGRQALLINTDLSLLGFNQPYEPMEGAGAVAALLSNEPRLVSYDLDAGGIYTQDVTDVIRPTPWIEVLNEESLYSYLEALDGAYEHYERKAGGSIDFNARFARSIYHVPFGGMAYRAHRRLLDMTGACSRDESDAHFARRVLPSLTYTRRIGSSYGGSTLIALTGLIDVDPDLQPGERISIFGFGSGYCGEFYSAVVRPEARAVSRAADLRALLDARLPLSIAQYEACEQVRADSTGRADWTPDRALLGDWYARAYASRRMLVLEGVERHHRQYGWS